MLYNNPPAAAATWSPPLLAEIAHEVPQISAFKECSGDARRIAELIDLCPGLDVHRRRRRLGARGVLRRRGRLGLRRGRRVPAPVCAALGPVPGRRSGAARRALRRPAAAGRLDMTPKLVQYFKAALDELGLGGGPCRPPRLPLTETSSRRCATPSPRGSGRAPMIFPRAAVLADSNMFHRRRPAPNPRFRRSRRRR